MTPSTDRSSIRVIGFDLARAVAVFGMVVVNFKIAMGASANGPAWLVDLVGLLEGRAAATFVVLAGVGVALMTRRARVDGDLERLAVARRRLLRRAALLFVVGLAYTPIWPADILHFYGVYLAVAALVLAAPTRHLVAAALGLVSLFMVLLFTLDYERGWDWETLHYDGFWTLDGMVRHLFFNGFHPVIPWLAFVFVGMVLGRLDLTDRTIRRRVLAWGVGTTAVAELTSRALVRWLSTGAEPTDAEGIAAVFGSAPMPPTLLYMLAGSATACTIIALAVAIGERWPDATWLRPLVHTGQLALTLYVGHVLVGMGTLEALGRLGDETLVSSLVASGVFCVAGLLFAHLWRRLFARGPLEAVLRRFADG